MKSLMQNILSEQTDQRGNTEFFMIFCQDVIWKRKFRACKVMEIIFSISVFQIFGHKLGKTRYYNELPVLAFQDKL